MNNKEQIMIDGVDILKEKINMCFILLLNKLETPETIEQTIYEHLDAFVKEWNDELVHKTQECEELKEKLRDLELKNTTLQNRYQQLDGSITECDRYRKALEEIKTVTKINCEEICGKNYDICKDRDCLTIQIKAIISKAKGEE